MNDADWMGAALREAGDAAASGEVPVGAVVVAAGRELGRGHNRTVTDGDPTAHAEIVALRAAARSAGNHRLQEATLYVTVEPCIMCVGAIVQARLRRVVFGCADPKAGALGSIYLASDHDRLNHHFETTAGVREAECAEVLRQFFRERRP